MALESNAMITKSEIILLCNKEGDCEFMGGITSGTASRILWKENYYWLTAGHVCNSKFEDALVLESKIKVIVANSGISEETEIIKIDYKKDLCLLKAQPNKTKSIAKNSPNPGDPVSATAYPGGIFDPKILPIYDGRWSGKITEDNLCLVTIPVAGGSSGGAIVNNNGEVVGVISSVLEDFNHVTVTPCYEDLLDFLESLDDAE